MLKNRYTISNQKGTEKKTIELDEQKKIYIK